MEFQEHVIQLFLYNLPIIYYQQTFYIHIINLFLSLQLVFPPCTFLFLLLLFQFIMFFFLSFLLILIDFSYPSSSSFIFPLWLSRSITGQLFYSLFNSFFINSTNLINFSSSICNLCLLVINRLKSIMKNINWF